MKRLLGCAAIALFLNVDASAQLKSPKSTIEVLSLEGMSLYAQKDTQNDSSLLTCHHAPPDHPSWKHAPKALERARATCAVFAKLGVRIPCGGATWAFLTEINDLLKAKRPTTPECSEAEVEAIESEIYEKKPPFSSSACSLLGYTRPAQNACLLPDVFWVITTDQYKQEWVLFGDNQARSVGGYSLETTPDGKSRVKALSAEQTRPSAGPNPPLLKEMKENFPPGR
jgi:hypothetical protein